MEKEKIIREILSDISKELFDIGVRETDRNLIENIAREIKVLIEIGCEK